MKNGLRLFGYSLVAAVLSVGVAACGSDDDSNCEPGSHGNCGEVFGELPEGGEFRFELFQFGPDDPNDQAEWDVAAQAFFFTSEDDPRSLDGVFDNMTKCGDYRSGDNFDNGNTPQGQAIVDRRTYFDVGAEVVATAMSDGSTITLPRRNNEIDFSSGGLTHPVLYRADLDDDDTLVDQIRRNDYYTLSGVGSAEGFAGLDLAGGVSAQGEPISDPAAYVPPNFTMTAPLVEADFYGDGMSPAITITRGEDLRFEWTNDEPFDSSSATNNAFVGVFNNAGGVDFYCYEDDAPAGGGVTIDASVTAELAEDPNNGEGGVGEDGFLLVGKFTHVGWEDANNGRFDFLGVNCKVVSFDAVDP